MQHYYYTLLAKFQIDNNNNKNKAIVIFSNKREMKI